MEDIPKVDYRWWILDDPGWIVGGRVVSCSFKVTLQHRGHGPGPGGGIGVFKNLDISCPVMASSYQQLPVQGINGDSKSCEKLIFGVCRLYMEFGE